MRNSVIGGVEMMLPLIVGAGVCKTSTSIRPFMRDDVSIGAVSTGSYTAEPSSGNEGKKFWPDDLSGFMHEGTGLNSFGMPNMGFAEAAMEISAIPATVPIIASVAGFSVGDYVEGVLAFNRVQSISAIKLNVACPNKHDEKPVPIAYDSTLLCQILSTVEQYAEKPIWLKLVPYITATERESLQMTFPLIDFSNVPVIEPAFFDEVMDIIWEHPSVRAVVYSNTLPNVIIRDASGNPVTTPNGGKAGLSGKILKPISIRLIRQASTMVHNTVDLIGSGGVLHGNDVVDYLESGASAVCITSGLFWSGNDPRLLAEYIAGSERLQNYLIKHYNAQRRH